MQSRVDSWLERHFFGEGCPENFRVLLLVKSVFVHMCPDGNVASSLTESRLGRGSEGRVVCLPRPRAAVQGGVRFCIRLDLSADGS